MSDLTRADRIRILCNVGHGHDARYARRYQRALDVILALVEPFAEPMSPPYVDGRGGSDYGRGFADGLHAKAHQVFAEMARALLHDDEEAAR